MKKLSATMLSVLRDMERGYEVQRHFDVYGPKPDGHTWQFRQGELIRRGTIGALTRLGLIVGGEEVRPYSGHRVMTYSLTDAGRVALATSERTSTQEEHG